MDHRTTPGTASPVTPIDRACEAVLIDEAGNEYPLPCDFSYDTRDPYAITFALRGSQRDVRWVFARALLAAGVFEPSGEADVHVWPTVSARGEARVAIELTNRGLTALALVPARDALAFLRATEAIVPSGTESSAVDIEAELAALLDASRGGVDHPE